MVGGAGATGALGLLAAACGGKDSNAGRAASHDRREGRAAKNADVSIVNYALTLEYLEADFYTRSSTAASIKDSAIATLAKRIARGRAGSTSRRSRATVEEARRQAGGASRRRSSTTCSRAGPKKILRDRGDRREPRRRGLPRPGRADQEQGDPRRRAGDPHRRGPPRRRAEQLVGRGFKAAGLRARPRRRLRQADDDGPGPRRRSSRSSPSLTTDTKGDMNMAQYATRRAGTGGHRGPRHDPRQSFIMRGALAAGAVVRRRGRRPFVREALAQDGGGDVDILNFALTLEYLEATFYTQALKQVEGLSRRREVSSPARSATTRPRTSTRCTRRSRARRQAGQGARRRLRRRVHERGRS